MSKKSRSTREYKGAGTGAASTEEGLRQFLALIHDAARAALESRALQAEDKECLEGAVRSAEEARQLGKPLGEIWASTDELIEFVRSSSDTEPSPNTEPSPTPSREHAAEHALECLWRLLAAVSAVSRIAAFSGTLERHMEFRQAELMRTRREERCPERQKEVEARQNLVRELWKTADPRTKRSINTFADRVNRKLPKPVHSQTIRRDLEKLGLRKV